MAGVVQWQTPCEALYSQTLGISCLIGFQFWEEMHFPCHNSGFPSNSDNIIELGVGFTKNVGNAMTWKVA